MSDECKQASDLRHEVELDRVKFEGRLKSLEDSKERTDGIINKVVWLVFSAIAYAILKVVGPLL